MKKIVSFGEIMMRLSAPGYKRLKQTGHVETNYGGTEANVAVSLANMGMDVIHVTRVSDDFVGDAATCHMQKFGVNTKYVLRGKEPLGIYFVEQGAVVRPSIIAYNRSNSAFTTIQPNSVDWHNVLDGADWFHWTGITPALSEGAYQCLKNALLVAKEKGVTVSADPTFRKGLWNYGLDAKQTLKELVALSDIFVGGINEMTFLLDIEPEYNDQGFVKAAIELQSKFPRIKKIADKTRADKNASWHKIQSRLWTGKELLSTREIEITHIVDRIGTGDAFATGIIYGLLHYAEQEAIDFANAACAIKHTIQGDVNLTCENEIKMIANGNTTGRMVR